MVGGLPQHCVVRLSLRSRLVGPTYSQTELARNVTSSSFNSMFYAKVCEWGLGVIPVLLMGPELSDRFEFMLRSKANYPWLVQCLMLLQLSMT